MGPSTGPYPWKSDFLLVLVVSSSQMCQLRRGDYHRTQYLSVSASETRARLHRRSIVFGICTRGVYARGVEIRCGVGATSGGIRCGLVMAAVTVPRGSSSDWHIAGSLMRHIASICAVDAPMVLPAGAMFSGGGFDLVVWLPAHNVRRRISRCGGTYWI